jgi:AraC family transcriptional activator FtrA
MLLVKAVSSVTPGVRHPAERLAGSCRQLAERSLSPAFVQTYCSFVAQHRVAVVIPRTFSVFEFSVAIEVFGTKRPELADDWYAVKVCSSVAGPLSTREGVLTAQVAYGVEAIDDAETVIVTQAASHSAPADQVVLEAIARAYDRGARIVSFCDGAFVLAAAGVLDGRNVTTHWSSAARLGNDYPRVRVHSDVLYVDDGQVLTCAGTAAALDLCLHIVRTDHGANVARKVARHMVMAPHRDGGQAQFVLNPVPEPTAGSSGIHRAIDYMTRHLDEEFSMSQVAAIAYMSTRNFTRRFREVTGTTPSQWIVNQRLTRARELLEETDESIDRVARLAGFGSAVTFRQRFAQALRTSPTTYRRAFRSPSAPSPAVATAQLELEGSATR